MIWPMLGASVDVLHAALMAAWVLGLPLLFWHRWPRLSRGYAIYAVAFVIVNKVSEWTLGECFLTTLARACWQASDPAAAPAHVADWFTVRLARGVFRLTPSRESIKLVGEIGIFVTALGVAITMRRRRARGRPSDTRPS